MIGGVQKSKCNYFFMGGIFALVLNNIFTPDGKLRVKLLAPTLPSIDWVNLASQPEPYRNTSTNPVPPPSLFLNSSRYVVMHVGKTAGSKVSCELLSKTFDLKCNDDNKRSNSSRIAREQRKKRSVLARASVCELHMDGIKRIQFCEKLQYNSFLFTVRHPLDRILSWFYHTKRHIQKSKKKAVYLNSIGCFRDANEFALSIVIPSQLRTESQHQHSRVLSAEKNQSTHCNKINLNTFDVTRGKRGTVLNHPVYNYEYYLRLTRKFENNTTVEGAEARRYPILVLRQEYLSQDWYKLEKAFGGGGETTKKDNLERFETKVNGANSTISSTSWRSLSKEERNNLCVALCRDIQAYKVILHRAVNLNQTEVQRSIEEVVEACPSETYEMRECEEKIYIIDWPKVFGNMTREW